MMGRNQTMQTYSPRPRDIERKWYVVDADGAVLGRLASEVAKILRGKHKPIFAPHMDTGDNVIVVNARGIRLTGGKEGEKVYHRHSGYPGGIRRIEYSRLMAERPAVVVEKAIRGMLPKNRLGRQMFHKLAVYEGPDHPHQAQQPVRLGLGEIPKWEGLPKPKPPKARPVTEAKKEEKGPQPKRPGARRPSGAARRAAKPASAAPVPSPRGRRARTSPAEATPAPARGRRTAGSGAKAKSAGRRTRAAASPQGKAETEKPKRTPRRPRRKKET